MSSDTSKTHYDDPQPSGTALVGVIGGLVLLALVVFAQVLFYNVQRGEDERKLHAVQLRELLDLQTQQMAQINGYRLVDAEKGLAAIPIDEAIRLYVQEVATTRPASQAGDTGRDHP
jgi:ATP/ADP translocase